MKVTAAISLALAGSAMAAGAADTVNQVLTQIASDIKEFDAAIKAYAGDASQVIASSDKIQQSTNSGAQKISAGSDLTLTDAVGITSNVQGLQTTLDTTLSDLKSIGDKLAANGQCSKVLEGLAGNAKAAQNLQDAITSKAPAETKAVAQQLGGAIGASLEDTNTYFKKTCANAPSGGASSGGKGSDSSSHGGAGGHDMSGGSSAGGSSSGSKTNKASKTSSVPKPATYTGAANVLTAPFMGALALAVFAM